MECGRVEKVEGAGMKITFDVPATTICLTLSGVYADDDGLAMGTKTVSTEEIESRKMIICKWRVNNDEQSSDTQNYM